MLNKRVICTVGCYKGMSGKVISETSKSVHFIDERTGLEVTDCHKSCVEIGSVEVKTTYGSIKRILHTDIFGLYVKHEGVKQAIEKFEESYVIVPTSGEIHDFRNN